MHPSLCTARSQGRAGAVPCPALWVQAGCQQRAGGEGTRCGPGGLGSILWQTARAPVLRVRAGQRFAERSGLQESTARQGGPGQSANRAGQASAPHPCRAARTSCSWPGGAVPLPSSRAQQHRVHCCRLPARRAALQPSVPTCAQHHGRWRKGSRLSQAPCYLFPLFKNCAFTI